MERPARAGGPERVFTPEAVALDLQVATVATRGLAQLVDVLLQGVAALLVVAALSLADVESASGAVFVTVVLVAVFLVRIGYPVVFETRFGATLGHMALGLRVVTVDGAPIRARQALARVAVGLFEIDSTFGAVALLTAATRRDGRRLGDLAAGTQVVSTRVGTGAPVALEVTAPTHLADWSATLDTSGLTRPERTALRRYLLRAGDLPPARRDELATGLVQRLLPRLAVSPPERGSAHDTLVAIAASLDAAPAPAGLDELPPPAPPSGPFAPPR